MSRLFACIALCAVASTGALMAEEEKPPTAFHGGLPRLVGDDVVELVQDSAAGKLTIYITGEDTKPYATAAQPLTAQVKVPGATALQTVTLQPTPQPGDPAGKSSAFAGADASLIGKTGLTVIVRVELDEKQQRVVFTLDKK